MFRLLAITGLVAGLALCRPLVAAETSSAAPSAVDAAARIDEMLAARWKTAGVAPAAPASNEVLLRRLYLDLTGVIPTVWEAREFLADDRPQARRELIDQLLDSPAHSTHLADLWRDLMLPRQLDPQQSLGVVGLQSWLRRQFADNQRYDRIVADLLVATGGEDGGAALFYTAMGVKPEEIGTTTARIFLGVRLDCAQCHDHPFEEWTQNDFWGYAAFFARLEQRGRNFGEARLVDVSTGDVKLPDSDTVVPAQYPGGDKADPNDLGTRRQQLAIWLVSRENPYLARATVNLVWAQLFGRGLVEPLDDFGVHNPPSHPEVLEFLSESFIASGFDLRWLYRTLANTRAYQMSSTTAEAATAPPELFASVPVKTLTPEQLYDSVTRVALRPAGEAQSRAADTRRLSFLSKMQTLTKSVTDFELSVPQALSLMNGPELGMASSLEQSRLLTALEAPIFNESQCVEAAYLATLTRLPSSEEQAPLIEYLKSQPADGRKAALSDVVWALVNSAEFSLNR